jgi:CheY-like chemotaxis protein
MPEKILFVDDDPTILSAFLRLLRHETLIRDYPSLTPFVVDTAPGGPEALAVMRQRGPYAVIVSDLRMPGMDGVQLLEETRTVSPQSVRILLTGQGDIEAAIEAVNRGGLFRFLTKPCPPETLVPALDAALKQYLLVTAERQLLDETLAGSVKVMTEVLSLVNPTAFSRALRVRRIVHHIVERLSLADAWQLEVASLLSQIGYLTLGVEPDEYDGETGPRVISQHRQTHPAAARDLLANIPRLGQVAAIVGAQRDAYDPADGRIPLVQRDPVKLGAQVLRSAIEFDAGMCGGLSPSEALSRLRMRRDFYDPRVVEALTDIDIPAIAYVPRRLPVADLQSGMLLDQDVRNHTGLLLVSRGHEVTLPLLIRLRSLVSSGAIAAQLRVLARAEA